METIKVKRKAVVERIEFLERAIRMAMEYLESGQHADWHAFRPFFGRKGDRPPHKDWVKNVFLRRHERSLVQAEKLLQRFEHERVSVRNRRQSNGRGGRNGVGSSSDGRGRRP